VAIIRLPVTSTAEIGPVRRGNASELVERYKLLAHFTNVAGRGEFTAKGGGFTVSYIFGRLQDG
jgi:hypothetical protein